MAKTSNTTLPEGVGFTPGGVFDVNHIPTQVTIPAGEPGPAGPQGYSVTSVRATEEGTTVELTFVTDNPESPDLPTVSFTIPEGTGTGNFDSTLLDLREVGDEFQIFYNNAAVGSMQQAGATQIIAVESGHPSVTTAGIGLARDDGLFTNTEHVLDVAGEGGIEVSAAGGRLVIDGSGIVSEGTTVTDLSFSEGGTTFIDTGLTILGFNTSENKIRPSADPTSTFIVNDVITIGTTTGTQYTITATSAADLDFGGFPSITLSPGFGPGDISNGDAIFKEETGFTLTLTDSAGDTVTSNLLEIDVTGGGTAPALNGLSNVDVSTATYGQGIIKLNADGADNEFTAVDIPQLEMLGEVPTGDDIRILRSIRQRTIDPDNGTLGSIVWTLDADTPIGPGEPTGTFDPTGLTQWEFNTGRQVVLTIKADTMTDSYFGVGANDIVSIINNVTSEFWTAEITSPANPTDPASWPSASTVDELTNAVREIKITLTALSGANQNSGSVAVNTSLVVDNLNTHPPTADLYTFGFVVGSGTPATVAATWGPTSITFGAGETTKQYTSNINASGGPFLQAPVLTYDGANAPSGVTFGTPEFVNNQHYRATYTVTNPGEGNTQNFGLRWNEIQAQPTGALGQAGLATTASGSPQQFNLTGPTAPVPSSSGTPPATTESTAFAVPPTVSFGVSGENLEDGQYEYRTSSTSGEFDGDATPIAGSSADSTSLDITGTAVYPDSGTDGYAEQYVEVGYQPTGGDYMVVDGLENIMFDSYLPIILRYNLSITTDAEFATFLNMQQNLDNATETIIPMTTSAGDQHVFTPASGNIIGIFFPNNWQTVTGLEVVLDSNDQPLGVTPIADGNIPVIEDAFGNEVQYTGFYIVPITPGNTLRINSITTS